MRVGSARGASGASRSHGTCSGESRRSRGCGKGIAWTHPRSESVKEAERLDWAEQDSKSYLGQLGNEVFNRAMSALVLGDGLEPQRTFAVQAPGGCGALRLHTELIRRLNPQATVWVSDPTWPNHRAIVTASGLAIATYPYYSTENGALLFDEMMVAASCSKNFGLYRDRVGVAIGTASTPAARDVATGSLAAIARESCSMPPDHGASVAARILTTDKLRETWRNELDASCPSEMARRIASASLRARAARRTREPADRIHSHTGNGGCPWKSRKPSFVS